jgi:hypothetical protein
VTRKPDRVETFLLCLLVALLPTQLALHFWPDYAFVFGIRVDYLAPAIYLTDLVFGITFFYWLIKNIKEFLAFLGKHKNRLILLVSFAAINIVFSSAPLPTLNKWVKVVELCLLSYYVFTRGRFFQTQLFFKTLFVSSVFVSLLAIAQFFLGRTIGGPFYFFGERAFNISSPGIALVRIFGSDHLRAYSIFSHPNSLAGFLAITLILLISRSAPKTFALRVIGLGIIVAGIVLTFSLSAFAGLVFCAAAYLLFIISRFSGRLSYFVLIGYFILSLALPKISGLLLDEKVNSLRSDIFERLELSSASGKMAFSSPVFGTGLNTFVINVSKIKVGESPIWLLQPVHNLPLLVFSEAGLVGLVILYFLLWSVLKKVIENKDASLLVCMLFILFTSLTDHYWFTLQQNMFLVAVIFGLAFFDEKILYTGRDRR